MYWPVVSPAQKKLAEWAGIALLAGGAGAWLAHRPTVPVGKAEPPALEQHLPGGSTVLARDPAAKLRAPELPKGGGRVVRQQHLDIRPFAPEASTGRAPDIGLDLALVANKDGQRVVAKAENGTILGGIDVPMAPAQKVLKNSLGISYGTQGNWGLYYDHDFSRLRTGVEINQTKVPLFTGVKYSTYEIRVKVGITW